MDFDRFFTYIKEIGYDGTFTVEATAFNSEGVVDVKMLNEQVKRIKEAVA